MNPGVDGESAFAEMGGATTPNLDIVSYHSKLVGVTFEGRQDIIKMLKGDEPLRFRREKDNPYDACAVAVDVEVAETWQPIGYIAKDKNRELAKYMDMGWGEPQISISGLTGGDGKSLGVNVHISYEKVKDESTPISEPQNAKKAELTVGSAEDRVVMSPEDKLKAILEIASESEELYTSKVTGKSIYLKVVDGHKRLDNFLSGSKFPSLHFAEFPKEDVISNMCRAYDIEPEHLLAMWEGHGLASRSFGTGIHAAMEVYDTYRALGEKTRKKARGKGPQGPNRALSKNPFLYKVVDDFHAKFGGPQVVLSEQFVWLEDERLCGTIDRLKVLDPDKRIVRIQDFKTDANIHEKKDVREDSPFKGAVEETKLGYHTLQLSFYAYILKRHGYTVEGLDLYWLNPEKLASGENAWEEYSREVIDITKGL